MAQCQGCKRDREKHGYDPREMIRLPAEITDNKTFARKTMPFYLCEHCDERSLAAARKTYQDRVN